MKLELVEAKLVRTALPAALLYAAPALLVTALLPTLDLLAWNLDLSIDWAEFKIGGVVFSLVGFVALGATLCNATLAYATASSNAEITSTLRWAARNLYAALIGTLSLIVLAFALNVYDILLNPDTGAALMQVLWLLVAVPGMLLTLLCTVLVALKLSHFIRSVLHVLRMEKRDV